MAQRFEIVKILGTKSVIALLAGVSLSQLALAGDTAATLAFRPTSIQAEQQSVSTDEPAVATTASAATLAFRPAAEQTSTPATGEAPSASTTAATLAFRPASEQSTGTPAGTAVAESGEQSAEVAAASVSSR